MKKKADNQSVNNSNVNNRKKNIFDGIVPLPKWFKPVSVEEIECKGIIQYSKDGIVAYMKNSVGQGFYIPTSKELVSVKIGTEFNKAIITKLQAWGYKNIDGEIIEAPIEPEEYIYRVTKIFN